MFLIDRFPFKLFLMILTDALGEKTDHPVYQDILEHIKVLESGFDAHVRVGIFPDILEYDPEEVKIFVNWYGVIHAALNDSAIKCEKRVLVSESTQLQVQEAIRLVSYIRCQEMLKSFFGKSANAAISEFYLAKLDEKAC
jgi:hypothetical protein